MENFNDKYYEPYGYTIPVHTGNQCTITYGVFTFTDGFENTKVKYRYILDK